MRLGQSTVKRLAVLCAPLLVGLGFVPYIEAGSIPQQGSPLTGSVTSTCGTNSSNYTGCCYWNGNWVVCAGTTTETSTSTQNAYSAPAQFSFVTINLDGQSTRTVNDSCVTVGGYVWWAVGPIPPLDVWYTVSYPNGTETGNLPYSLAFPYTVYGSDPPTPSSALYTAAPFSQEVCNLQNSFLNAPYLAPNTITLYAQDPTNTFSVSVYVYYQPPSA